MELVTRNYWWPGVTRDVGRYVEGRDLCQSIIRRVCGQTLGLGLVDRNKTVVIISLQRMESM